MNLSAPRARMAIGLTGPCRWRSNGRLRRCLATHREESKRRKSSKGASDALLRHPQGTYGAIEACALGASSFLNRLPFSGRPDTLLPL
jgi:hypothetical protein